MPKDMLGSVVSAAVGVPQSRLEALAKIASALGQNNSDADALHAHLRKIIRDGLAPAAQPRLDTIVRVDRSIRATYPDWVKKVEYPELESVGPNEYGLADVEQWLLEGQHDGGWVKGERIEEHLKSNKMLESCLGLRDLEEIQKQGIQVFRKFFAGKAVFAWKSVVLDRGGDRRVPCLVGRGGAVVLDWGWLGSGWGAGRPALRLAS